ncbi:hypothetical protein SCUP234_04574 [Seiridium cupressi]
MMSKWKALDRDACSPEICGAPGSCVLEGDLQGSREVGRAVGLEEVLFAQHISACSTYPGVAEPAAFDGTIPRCGAAIWMVVQSAEIPYAGTYCLRGVVAFGILAGQRSGIPTARMVCEQRSICLLRLKTWMRESCLLVLINPSRLGWLFLGPPLVTASWYAKEASIAAGFEDE